MREETLRSFEPVDPFPERRCTHANIQAPQKRGSHGSQDSHREQAAAKPGRRGGGGGGIKKKTVSKTFSDSLQTLMEKLRATEHHYIRCLKPNQSLNPGARAALMRLRALVSRGSHTSLRSARGASYLRMRCSADSMKPLAVAYLQAIGTTISCSSSSLTLARSR